MKITFLPRSALGRWAITLIAANLVIYSAGAVLPYKTGFTGFEAILQNPLQTIISFIALSAGLAAGICALIAVSKKQERSILVFLTLPALVMNGVALIGSAVYLLTL
jgi:hypothetical protein